MRSEYLLFDLVVLSGPAVASVFRGRTYAVHRYSKAFAALIAVVPWIGWDVAVADRHWSFSTAHTLGPRIAGLPIEEWLFYLAVPLACLYTWEALLRGPDERPRARARLVPWLGVLPLAFGIHLSTTGPAYTALAAISLGVGMLADAALGTGLLARARGWIYVALLIALTIGFDNWLTGRGIVTYDPAVLLGPRIGTMPIEDLGFGLGLCLSVTALYQLQIDRVRADPSDGLVARLIRWRFGGYRQQVVAPDPALPLRPASRVRVLVVGGGLAGMGAASALAERGVEVVLRERNPYLGGKIGAWPVTLSTGEQVVADHGFHAFFRQYWNQRVWLDRVGITPTLREVEDYTVLPRQGPAIGFSGTSPVPVLNLLDLARVGVYRFWSLATSGTGEQLEVLLRYDRDRIFAEWDGISFATFAERARLPWKLRLIFTTFARAFFAEDHNMSMAEMIRSFHFYYLSNDKGLVYDHPTEDYDRALIAPLRAHLDAHGTEIRTGSPVESVARDGEGFRVDGERYDAVIVASDAGSTRRLLAPLVDLSGLQTGQRYAVLRVWFDRLPARPVDPFVITERHVVLDAISWCDRLSAQAADWSHRTGGSVVELHCYAVPDALPTDGIREALLEELFHHQPELRSAGVVGEDLQVRDDFPAFHVGSWAGRPETGTGIDGLYLAGDWVKLPWPAMLMEACQMSALLAANAVLARAGVQGWPIWSVPQRGILDGVPQAPKRNSPTQK